MSVSSLATSASSYHPSASPTLSVQRVESQKPVSQVAPPTKQEIKPEQPPKNLNKNIGASSIPDSPNLITGVTRDPRGNPLSNILVEIKDKENNPIRAFKTNEVGKFASATPLMNGTYTVEFEDPKAQNKFEKITMHVAGQIIMPIEAISIDTREELRRSLFAAN